MDRWLIPAACVLVGITVLCPWLLLVYGAIIFSWGISVYYNVHVLPGPYLSLSGDGGLRVNWISRETRDAYVLIADGGNVIKEIAPDFIAKDPLESKFVINSALVGGLEPGRRYTYKIVDTLPSKKVRVVHGGTSLGFAFPSPGFIEGRATRVAALGDMQPKRYAPPLLQFAIMKRVKKERPDILLYLGDHTNTGNDLRAWLWYIRLVGTVAASVPVLGTAGNHDKMHKRTDIGSPGDEAYKAFLNYPGNKFYYGVHVFGLHLVCLDYAESIAPGSLQFGLVSNEINSRGEGMHSWLVVLSHSTPYNTAIKPSSVPVHLAEIREHVVPLVEGHDAIWLGGHEHAYQKFTVNGIPYITSAATSSFHDHEYSREHMDMNVKKFHFVMIQASKERLSLKALPLRGNLIDDFNIERKAGQN